MGDIIQFPRTQYLKNINKRPKLSEEEINKVTLMNQKRTADHKEIRTYSKSKKDLGNIEDYDKFLNSLKEVFSKVYDALKFNKRCISVVMDIRKKDKFFPLHEDQTRIMKEIGFDLEEYVIWDRQIDYNNMKTLGYPYVFRFNKVHEFICIYWKR